MSFFMSLNADTLQSDLFSIITIVVGYLISMYPLYYMYKTANLKNPKIAFIPLINEIKTYNLANFSAWWCLIVIALFIPILLILFSFWAFIILLLLISIAIIIFNCYIRFKLFKNFGLSTFCCILGIFFPIILYWYIALTKSKFIGTIKTKYLKDNNTQIGEL